MTLIDHDDFDALLISDDFGDLLNPEPQLTLDSLAELPQWVAWREEPNERGHLQKLPRNPHNPAYKARSNDPRTWGTRRQARRAADQLPALEGEGIRGIGIELGKIVDGRPLLLGGIDLDSCLNPETGDLTPWAAEVIDRFASYAEVSPSGKGVKVFFTYSSTDMDALSTAMGMKDDGTPRHRRFWSRGEHCEIGLDVSGRYYAVTGSRWAECPATFRTVPLDDLLWLIREAGPAFLREHDGTASNSADAPTGDQSGSGAGLRVMIRLAAEGNDKDAALATIRSYPADKAGNDDAKASEWLGRTTQRQVNRAWEKAEAKADAMRPRETSPDEFDDLEARDPITAALNRKHAVVMPKGRTYIATFQPDGSIGLGTPRDIHAFYENYRVPTAGGKSTEAASRRWMRDPDRRTYPGGVTFAPAGCPADTLNLWSGWAVQPDATASCSLFLDHVYRVVCNGNREHADWVIGWFAHMVQRPEEKPGVALVLRGAKGAGKDTVAEYFAHLPGRRHVSTVAEPEHITGRFNARLENSLLLHVQEGAWAGDRKSEGTLKYLITSDHIEIERKGIDGFNMPSVLRLFISANAEWVVPASADERRWAVFEVSDKRRTDEAYFKALRAEMNSGGPSALLHYLRHFDLSGFNVRKAPETEGLRNQKLASLRSVELWWFEILSRGTFPCSLDDGGGWASSVQTIARDSLRRDYVDWMKGRRYDGEVVEERYFGRRLRDMLPTLNDRRPAAKPGITRIRQYEVPALADCRAAFDQWMGQPVDWEPVEG